MDRRFRALIAAAAALLVGAVAAYRRRPVRRPEPTGEWEPMRR